MTFGTFHINNSWSWRIPSAAQALPSLLQVFLILHCPESPRWLISKGRDSEALRVLAYYHANGSTLDPLVLFEFQEIKSAIEKEREHLSQTDVSYFLSSPLFRELGEDRKERYRSLLRT